MSVTTLIGLAIPATAQSRRERPPAAHTNLQALADPEISSLPPTTSGHAESNEAHIRRQASFDKRIDQRGERANRVSVQRLFDRCSLIGRGDVAE
ncbi:hypothetical protein [Methylobacterium marchantiae]|uniref:Uncharacterized protein n=1 Tax=Methylobacterium marchantiae TaxID=600331 RepID=A0ABW3X343_9HYPH